MARVINRKSPEILAEGRAIGVDYVLILERGFYFPKFVAANLGVHEGRFIHFINDDDNWSFYINSDRDGFHFAAGDKSGSFVVNNKALVKMFLASTGQSIKDKLLITLLRSGVTNTTKIYQIHLQKNKTKI